MPQKLFLKKAAKMNFNPAIILIAILTLYFNIYAVIKLQGNFTCESQPSMLTFFPMHVHVLRAKRDVHLDTWLT